MCHSIRLPTEEDKGRTFTPTLEWDLLFGLMEYLFEKGTCS